MHKVDRSQLANYGAGIVSPCDGVDSVPHFAYYCYGIVHNLNINFCFVGPKVRPRSKQTSNLKQHLMVGDFGVKPALFSCTFCAYRTKNNCNLRRHLIGVHDVLTSDLASHGVGYLFPCKLCPFHGRNGFELKMHINTVHDGN